MIYNTTDLRQSPQYAKYIKSIGWTVEKINGCHFYIRKIPLTPFSIIKVQRPKKIPFKKIDQLAKKYCALQIIIEPNYHILIYDKQKLQSYDYRLSKSPFLPTKTIHLDLTQSKAKILAQMKKDARYGIRNAKKEALQLIKVQDLTKFHQAWKKSDGWNRWVPSLKSLQTLKKAFGKKAIFLTVAHSNTLVYRTRAIAGVAILTANRTAYYYYAFTSKEGRKNFAQYLLVWEAIKLTKKQRCKVFDFEGIYDERFPIKTWKGFSHFKKSFGGKEIEFPGSFTKYYFPLFRRPP